MIENTRKIALITPVKDELENLPKFLSSLQSQTISISHLVIVENDSTDGSKQYLEGLNKIANVEFLKVLNISFEDKSYRVGKKYATIIRNGLDYIQSTDHYTELDYVGILDCDVFPEPEYYEKLTDFMASDSTIGIASGITFTEEGLLHIANPNFVRGNSRLWTRECLDDAGYVVAHTADTVSMAMAHLKGWKTRTLKTAKVTSREVNVRFANHKNKGYHAYYRGHTLFFIALRSLFLMFVKGKVQLGYQFLMGYLEGMFGKKARIKDKNIRRYFRFYFFNKLIGKYN